jgi:hypothetical protein
MSDGLLTRSLASSSTWLAVVARSGIMPSSSSRRRATSSTSTRGSTCPCRSGTMERAHSTALKGVIHPASAAQMGKST